jgi:uncharacterized membrane protein
MAESSDTQMRRVYYIGIIIKLFLAIFEMTVGFLILVFGDQIEASLLEYTSPLITDEALATDPKDAIANFFRGVTEKHAGTSLHFSGLYLFCHGFIKFLVVFALLRNKLWAYPTAIIVFGLFIIYQLYSFSHTSSTGMLLLTIFDTIVVILISREYRHIKARRGQ